MSDPPITFTDAMEALKQHRGSYSPESTTTYMPSEMVPYGAQLEALARTILAAGHTQVCFRAMQRDGPCQCFVAQAEAAMGDGGG